MRLRLLFWTAALALGGLSSSALACPTCGIGDRFGGWGIVVYGLFMATPFAVSFGIYKYIRNLNRLD
jgi:hypothetical protein